MANIPSSFELNGNLLTNEFYKFGQNGEIIKLDENDCNKLINDKNTIKMQFPYGINGIMSDIRQYSINNFNLNNIINIIKDFYSANLSLEEKETIYSESDELGEALGDISPTKDILRFTNQCFLEEINYENGIYIVRTGS